MDVSGARKPIQGKKLKTQTFAYILPILGLWVIFLVWITVKTSNNESQTMGVASTKNQSITITGDPENGHNQSNILKVMTWNLQGLMQDKLEERTKAVVEVINTELPDVIFFQELISESYQQLSDLLKGSYENVIAKKNPFTSYFTGIFYKRHLFTLKDHKVVPFPNSVMERTQLIVRLASRTHKGLRMALVTTHLESLPRFSMERISQLKQCFETCMNFPDKYSVVFAGDLNLEENEEEGSVPENLKDLWIEGGSSEMEKYTWDLTQNQNERQGNANQESKVRYDRMYFRPSSPEIIKFEKFELHGKKRVMNTNYFPSDHWAIISSFKILHNSNKK